MENSIRDAAGICKFCGQIVSIEYCRKHGMTEDADYLATRNCNCRESRQFDKQELDREEAEKRRQQTLDEAEQNIEALFGPAAAEHFAIQGLREVDIKIRDHIYETAVLVYDGLIRSATITDKQGITAKIVMRGKDMRLLVERSEGIKIRQEA